MFDPATRNVRAAEPDAVLLAGRDLDLAAFDPYITLFE